MELQEIQPLLPHTSAKGLTCQDRLDDRVQWHQNGEHMHVGAWKCRMMMSPLPDGAQDWIKTGVVPHRLLGDCGHLVYLFVLDMEGQQFLHHRVAA